MSLETALADVNRQLDETMAQTFRARGAKLEALTAKLEQLEAEQRRLEAQIASGGGGGGGGAPAQVLSPPPVVVAPPVAVAPRVVPLQGPVVPSSPMPQRPPPSLSPSSVSSPMPSRPPPSDPYAGLRQGSAPAFKAAATSAATTAMPYTVPAPAAVVPQPPAAVRQKPTRPIPPPAAAATAAPMSRPSFSDVKARLLARKAELEARLASATGGVSQLERLRAFLDRKEKEMAARAKDLGEREGMLHYVLNVDKVTLVQRKIRKWRARRRDAASATAAMLLKVVQDYKRSDVAKEAKHRWQALVEIYNSEKTYLASLELLIKHYMRPIEAASQQPGSCLQPADALVIFNTLDVIAAYSSKMVENLAYATVSVKKSEKMGNVFLQMVPTMALYERYYLGFDDSLHTLKRLSKNKRFVELLAQCRKASGSQLNLEQLLIMPVQRLPRYAILLDALIKHTPATHSDRPSLQEAEHQVKLVLSGINSKAKERETIGAVAKIAQKVSGVPPTFQLVTNSRRFVLADLMIFVVAGRIVTRKKPMHLFLFNDLILRTKPKRGVEDEYDFREAIPLTAAVVLEDLPDDKTVSSGFVLRSPEKAWTFMADVPIKKDTWTEALAAVLKNLQPVVTAGAAAAGAHDARPATAALTAVESASSAAALVSSARIWDSVEVPQPAWPSDDVKDAVFAPVKGNVCEYGGSGGESSLDAVFNDDLRCPYYQKYLKFRPHSLYVGRSPDGKTPLLLIVERTDAPGGFALLSTPLRDFRFRFHGGVKEVEEAASQRLELALRLKSLVRVTSDSSVAAVLCAKVAEFESARIVSHYKIGLLEWRPGQSEDEAFANALSPPFEKFLSLVGERIKLKGWTKFRGGLNVHNDETGVESVFAERNGFQVMFHVAPLLPANARDKQQLERKRHLGNDVVVIVFREAGPAASLLDVSKFRSQFNHVFIVVSPAATDSYRVSVSVKPGVPYFGPRIPPSGIVSARDLGAFLVAKAVNGERAAMHAKDFRALSMTTRSGQLNELLDLANDGKARGGGGGGGGGTGAGSGMDKKGGSGAAVSAAAVDPSDPRELERRLQELKVREKSAASSLEGLKKLASFYSRDPKAKAETNAKVAELQAEHADILSQIAAIESKLRSSAAAATVAQVTIGSKSVAERQTLLATYQGQLEKQRKTVAQLEKLLGFYAKDPSGATETKAQLATEKASLLSLEKRVAELQTSLAQPAAGANNEADAVPPMTAAAANAEDDHNNSDLDDDDDDDHFDVDALAGALRGFPAHPLASATLSPTPLSSASLANLAGTLRSVAVVDDDDDHAVAGTLSAACPPHAAGDRVWILSDSPEFVYVSGPNGEGYVPAGLVVRDDVAGAGDEAAATAATLTRDCEPFQAGDRVWILSEDDQQHAWVSGERGEGYVPLEGLLRDE